MIPCISVETMRLSDSHTIEKFVPSLELMYHAAYGVFFASEWQEPVAIVVGSGNNGGDGFALACILKEKNIRCSVFTVSRKLSADSAYYAEKAQSLAIPVLPFEKGCLAGFATVTDCLLGTGFQGPVRENYRVAIEEINASDAYVVSVDINSGMNGDTGMAELAVYSDLTVTIGFVKTGLITENAGLYIKKLVCADIGIILMGDAVQICADEEWQEGCIHCPKWLDMDVIDATGIIL